MAESYLEKAQKLKNANPSITPQQIQEKLGPPPEGKRLESKGRGKVGYKSLEARRKGRSVYNKQRTENRRISTGSLTKEQRAQNRAQEEEARQRRAAGEDVEILHGQRVSLTGPQLKDVKERGGSVTKARKKLKEAYGGALGDVPENRTIGSGAENRQEEVDWSRVQKRLGEMEESQPSLPNHPDLITTGQQAMMGVLTFAGAAAKLTWDMVTGFGL